jgi:hypothetical protein
MDILLAGIRIAAMRGDSFAWVAKLSPTILYRIESIKLTVTMRLPVLA